MNDSSLTWLIAAPALLGPGHRSFDEWLLVLSDGTMAAAYVSVLSVMVFAARRRGAGRVRAIGLLFTAFLVCGAAAHLMDVATLWWPAHRVGGIVKAVTAMIALAAAVAIIAVIPSIMSLPTLKRTKEELEAALVRERTLSAELRSAHEALEQRTSQLAVRERRMRDAAGAAKACSLSWEIESGLVLWELGCIDAMRSALIPWSEGLSAWPALIGNAAERLREESRRAYAEERLFHGRYPLRGQEGRWHIRITATPDPAVRGQPATMSGMFGLVPADEP